MLFAAVFRVCVRTHAAGVCAFMGQAIGNAVPILLSHLCLVGVVTLIYVFAPTLHKQ